MSAVAASFPAPSRRARKPLLQLRGVETFYGKIQALKGIDLDVNEGEIVTLIGANGAGKSTTMMTIFGIPARAQGNHHLQRRGHHGAAAASSSRACRSRNRRRGGASFRA